MLKSLGCELLHLLTMIKGVALGEEECLALLILAKCSHRECKMIMVEQIRKKGYCLFVVSRHSIYKTLQQFYRLKISASCSRRGP